MRSTVVAAVVLSLGGIVAAPLAFADSVPFTDNDQNGFLALCDKSGHQVTSGDIRTAPFVWNAIASTGAPTEYTGSNRKAVLAAFQPRQQVDPAEWSGGQLTASSTYSNPAHPVAQATDTDGSLLAFLQGYPARWDGLVEVRMYFSAPDLPPHAAPYPATVLRVSGNRWTVVRGGTLSCQSGTGTSVESLYLPAARTTVSRSAAPVAGTSPAAPPPSAAGSGVGASEERSDRSAASSFLGSPASYGVGVLLLGLLAGLVVSVRRLGPLAGRRG